MSLEHDITQITKLREAEPVFKPATPEQLAKRPKPVSNWKPITSVEQLKRLAEYGVEVVITLGGGMFRSTKYVMFNPDYAEDAAWEIDSYIDGSLSTRLEDTNILRAMRNGALWYDRDEYESSRQQGEGVPLPEAQDMVFKPATMAQQALRREQYPQTYFHGGREYGPRSNMGVCMSFVRGEHRGQSNSMSIRPVRDPNVTVLYSYGTPIALRQNDVVFICTQKYSSTTSKQQTFLRRVAVNNGTETRHVPPAEFVPMINAVGVYDMGRLHEAKPIFKPATPEQQAKRKEEYQKSLGAEAGDWASIAMAELAREENTRLEFGNIDAYERVNAVTVSEVDGRREWVIFEDYDSAERVAKERVMDDLEQGNYGEDFMSNHIYISETDRGMIAQEEADDYVDEQLNDEEVLEEASLTYEYDEIQEQIDVLDSDEDSYDEMLAILEKKQEDLLEEARDQVREKKSEEIERELEDPIQYFIHDRGMYRDVAELMKSNFIQIDYDDAADDIISGDGVGNTLATYDGSEISLPSGAYAYRTN